MAFVEIQKAEIRPYQFSPTEAEIVDTSRVDARPKDLLDQGFHFHEQEFCGRDFIQRFGRRKEVDYSFAIKAIYQVLVLWILILGALTIPVSHSYYAD